MNTQAHLLIGAAVLGRRDAPARNVAAILGTLTPDFAMFVMVAWQGWVLGRTGQQIFREDYYSPFWQEIFAVCNSLVVFAVLAMAGAALRRPWLLVFALAAILHVLIDIPLHVDDGHPPFWPLSDWIYRSPYSYWDVRHGAAFIAPAEFVLASVAAVWLLVRHRSWLGSHCHSPATGKRGPVYPQVGVALWLMLWNPAVDRRSMSNSSAGRTSRNWHLSDDEIMDAVEQALAMQGRGETVNGDRTHLHPKAGVEGHFNVLRGWLGGGINIAGVKTVGDFYDNFREGRPSEYAVLSLFDPRTGTPVALIEASGITDMRTGAVTAVGAKHLARQDSRVLGHIGARGSAYWNVRLLDRLFQFEEIRVHSRRAESRNAFAARLSRDLGRPVRATEDWRSCVEGADIVVEASRLARPEPHLKTAWISRGALVVPYGTKSALEDDLTTVMDKMIMDDWSQAYSGKLGALRRHVDLGLLSRETLYAELGEIVAGRKPGRESDSETILFWHRGMALSDIALGQAMRRKAARLGIGQRLRLY